MPYLPMVKAIAPNAPIGAACIRMRTMRKTTAVSASQGLEQPARRARRPAPARCRTGSRRTAPAGSRPSVKALKRVSGMMSSRKPVTVVLVRLADVGRDLASASSVAGSTLRPAPGWTTLATIRPIDERQRRDGEEIAERLGGDAAERAEVAHAGDAGDDGQEDDRRDDHLDQLDEAVAERLQAAPVAGHSQPTSTPSTTAISTWT